MTKIYSCYDSDNEISISKERMEADEKGDYVDGYVFRWIYRNRG